MHYRFDVPFQLTTEGGGSPPHCESLCLRWCRQVTLIQSALRIKGCVLLCQCCFGMVLANHDVEFVAVL